MSEVHICAIAKNEDKYIEDWLIYHFNLGFTQIAIYDNNIPDRKGDLKRQIKNSKKLTKEMKNKIIIIDATGKQRYQREAYNDYYNNNEFDWCAFIDIDEFIVLTDKSGWENIQDMVNDNLFTNATGIDLCWRTFSDGNIVDVPDDYIYNGKKCENITNETEREKAAIDWETKIPVYKRFTKETLIYESYYGKLMVRSRIKNFEIKIHDSMSDYIVKSADGKFRPNIAKIHTCGKDVYEDTKDIAYIAHYRTKTIREYLRQKYLNQSDAYGYSNRTLFIDDYFFKVNEKTAKKIEYYNKHHKPIILNILTDENDYDDNKNHNELIYICNQTKTYEKNPFIVDYNFVVQHENQIDIFNVI